MEFNGPRRLLHNLNGKFFVIDPRAQGVTQFDIISYRWGDEIDPYDCGIDGVDWKITLAHQKLDDIKRLMVNANIEYLWVDSVCINQGNDKEKAAEIARMFEYYKNARTCYILIDMFQVWSPQKIVDDLKFLDHILSHMRGATLATEALTLTPDVRRRLAEWEDKDWAFDVDKSIVRGAAVDLGVLNCYSTCINHVRTLFDNMYFSRVWTFQEMILGKNITMWGVNLKNISCIGELHTWMDLASDSKDKAYKLQAWIENSRVVKSGAVSAILRIIEDDNLLLNGLQTQVKGISSARTDIINGGVFWWYENFKGISNIFSAISIRPRKCHRTADIFRGLLGIFNGLFTADEIETKMSGDDIEKISYNFFKQLSTKTGYAWTKLAISSKDRGEWDWIPVMENYGGIMTTDVFAGVVNLGVLKKGEKGQAKATAVTSLIGTPRNYMKIILKRDTRPNPGFQFIFKGCNCGKKVKTGMFSTEPIETFERPRKIVKDETGRMLVQCATILGSILDPSCNIIEYRKRVLSKLQPNWNISDPNAKPPGWISRCVSGTPWENPNPVFVRVHNMSMNFDMVDITGCESRLANESTASIICEVRVNCGCTITAPFALIFEAITAMEGSFLGDTAAYLDKDNRIVLQDGLGLVQIGNEGKAYNLVAFGGEVNAQKSYASSCRSTKVDKAVIPKLPWPSGRALVREEFTHAMMRDYAYVETGGSGNLLICRNHLLDQYKIVGVCIDEFLPNKKGRQSVIIK